MSIESDSSSNAYSIDSRNVCASARAVTFPKMPGRCQCAVPLFPGFPRVWPIRVPLVILDHKLHSFFFVNVLGMAVQFMGITLAAVHASSCNHFSQARLIFICPSQVGTTVHDSGSIRWMS
jgi:hypothetical protein